MVETGKDLDGGTCNHMLKLGEEIGCDTGGTLREIYGPGFAAGHRSDMRLDTLLDLIGKPSLSAYLRSQKN